MILKLKNNNNYYNSNKIYYDSGAAKLYADCMLVGLL